MTSSWASSRSARPRPSAVVTLVAVALLSGCAVGPDFHRPAAPTVSGYTREALNRQTASAEVPGGEAQRFRPDQDVVEQWWTLFQSPALNAVVEKALLANPTIVSAQAALRQARALVDAQRGFFYPTVQGSFTGTRQHTSGTISPV
jgi:outer membrane protein TolC